MKDIKNTERIWDDYFKAISDRMRSHLIPLVNEAFDTNYSMDDKIELIQTEYKVPMTEGHYQTLLDDITIKINNIDVYHLECQINNEGDFSIRLFEYDIHVALSQARIDGNYTEIRFPRTVVIFPDINRQLPNEITVQVVFADGFKYPYKVKAIKVQNYSIKNIFEKKLYIFIPYILLRFKNRVLSKNNRLTKEELGQFIDEIEEYLDIEYEKGFITENQRDEYFAMIEGAAERVFRHRKELVEEVRNMTPRSYKLLSERMEEKDAEIEKKDAEIEKKEAEIEKKDAEIEKKDAEILRLKKIIEEQKV